MLHDEFSAPILDLSALSRVHGGSHRSVTPHSPVCASGNDASSITREQPSATAICDRNVNARDSLGIAAIIHAQATRDFTAALAEWQRASGTDRATWRRYVKLYIREERARLAISRTALRLASTRARKDAA